MLSIEDIDRVASKAALAALRGSGIRRVFSEPTTDSEGHDALNMTVVLEPEWPRSVNGRSVIDIVFQVGRDLQEAGESRLPIFSFATEEELAASDDPEY